MTPKFIYDPEQDCLREVGTPSDNMDVFEAAVFKAFLRVIPCAIGSKWPEGVLEEREDFAVIEGEACPRIHDIAFPITPQPRLYTQAEAAEIWDAGFNRAVFECSPHNGKQHDKQQFFLTRFNVEL